MRRACSSKLLVEGVDIVRLNLSHGVPDDHKQRAAAVREAAAKLGREVGVLADLQGPKIRIERFANGPVQLESGQPFALDCREDAAPGDVDACRRQLSRSLARREAGRRAAARRRADRARSRRCRRSAGALQRARRRSSVRSQGHQPARRRAHRRRAVRQGSQRHRAERGARSRFPRRVVRQDRRRHRTGAHVCSGRPAARRRWSRRSSVPRRSRI